MSVLKNITGSLLIDARAVFLNGAGLGSGEDRNKVIPKAFSEKVNGKFEKVPYVSAQAWRRWLRNTTNEENNWAPSDLQAIDQSAKGSTSKISTYLNPVDYPEDDLFGYMRSGKGNEESVQRTSPFKTSILKGIQGKRVMNTDEAFVHLKEGTPLPYSTEFYSTHLEGFFNLEYYRLGIYDNLGSHVELAKEFVDEYKDQLETSPIGKFERHSLKDAGQKRNQRAAGLLKGLAHLRGGAKMAAFGADVSPKVLILAGMECANPIFNDLFEGNGIKPALKIEALLEIIEDYKSKLSTPVYIGIRSGYLENEDLIKDLENDFIKIGSPISVTNLFIEKHLK
ncbi:type I-B CRISPR-associated protein Cas7/Cst2/DevR [Mariniflexile ostreae]|uniref:Type I-B CRISPR-associated protein Cas7/Cst2/DevR n=1 Tax=Mariniflexile ostreae TaxID=1520892 RepID=A0ABV5F7C7_9FLAO